MSNHTQGKWEAIHWISHAKTTVVIEDDCMTTGKRVIADCKTEEDATLIAAAPELLDALKAVLQWIDDYCETTGFESVEAQADAAIAKAEGGAQ
jgi:hypothetical protein